MHHHGHVNLPLAVPGHLYHPDDGLGGDGHPVVGPGGVVVLLHGLLLRAMPHLKVPDDKVVGDILLVGLFREGRGGGGGEEDNITGSGIGTGEDMV